MIKKLQIENIINVNSVCKGFKLGCKQSFAVFVMFGQVNNRCSPLLNLIRSFMNMRTHTRRKKEVQKILLHTPDFGCLEKKNVLSLEQNNRKSG